MLEGFGSVTGQNKKGNQRLIKLEYMVGGLLRRKCNKTGNRRKANVV
ncbi:hypothetical protein S101395_00312 [Bacillus sonorensis]|uniref:Uncharacterized protein n=1 Tax=Bacillus sonorensis TaxID=119858 RepID=A0ABM6LCI1_9BACI|nr:hypothetical protein S101395_00312 [Bacillus sonorensis]TWK80870.1 hypothetical protein CHCC20335_0824 [Bacillus paralicheniformis]